MGFFNINSSDFNELYFDMSELKNAFENKENSLISSLKPVNNVGFYNINSVRKGNVYYTDKTSKLGQDTIVKSSQGIRNISLYFNKTGNCYSANKKKGTNLHIPSNTNNVFFMQEYLNEISLLKKDELLETTGLHLPIPYFENLVNLYPNLFGDSFKRFEKGENFYLNNNFGITTPEMNHILSQIKNADLIGNCIEPYVDSKVLELLCLQFQDTLISPIPEIIKDEDKIREAAFILLSDIHNPPSIRDLALKVGTNRKNLIQGFKLVFKTTVYGYLFDHKMNFAEQLLKDTQYTTSEIALQCGYEYSSHFCTAFKRKFGVSPLGMRKK